MRKFRLYYDKEKEEEWLNEMCRKGWGMTNFFLGFYTFEPCASGEYTYQVDFPDFQRKKRKQGSDQAGVYRICGSNWGRICLFLGILYDFP